MSAPSDGARADARKARAEAMGSGRIEDMICPCSFPGYTHVTAVHGQPEPPSDWLAGVIADAKAEALREAAEALTTEEWSRTCRAGSYMTPISQTVRGWLRDRADRIEQESGR